MTDLLETRFYSLAKRNDLYSKRIMTYKSRSEEIYRIYKEMQDRIIHYSVRRIKSMKSSLGFSGEDTWEMQVSIDKYGEYLSEILEQRLYYTSESVSDAIYNAPTIKSYIKNQIHNGLWVDFCYKSCFCLSWQRRESNYNNLDEKYIDTIVDLADKIMSELPHIVFDRTKLKQRYYSSSSDISPWTNKFLKFGVKVGAKTLAGMIGRNLDFDFDFDCTGTSVSNTDFCIPNMEYNYDTDFDLDFNDDYSQSPIGDCNVSFLGNSDSDGFIPKGKIILERTKSGITENFDHYTNKGADYVKIGNKYIRIDVGKTVKINGIEYDCI